jgi:hypothetical protein
LLLLLFVCFLFFRFSVVQNSDTDTNIYKQSCFHRCVTLRCETNHYDAESSYSGLITTSLLLLFFLHNNNNKKKRRVSHKSAETESRIRMLKGDQTSENKTKKRL